LCQNIFLRRKLYRKLERKMAKNAKCAFCVAMALGRERQAAGEILTGKLGLQELAILLSACSPVCPIASRRSVTQ